MLTTELSSTREYMGWGETSCGQQTQRGCLDLKLDLHLLVVAIVFRSSF